MKLKKHLSNLLKVFICVAFIASAIEIHAQNGTTMTVSGTIVDAAGIPVIGAVVIDPANTSNGCISNVDGDFTMQGESTEGFQYWLSGVSIHCTCPTSKV